LGRGLGNPLICWGGMGAKGSTSANSWAREKFLTERPAPQARSPGLKVFQHRSFAAGHRDCQRIRLELDDISAVVLRAEDHDPVLARHRHFFLPQSSSASRFTAGAFGFFILSQSGERPER
jgi:hypothetical protein